jgi:tetratricopeptide (TPR) repeat protein
MLRYCLAASYLIAVISTLAAGDPVKIRSAIRLPTIELSSGVSMNSEKMTFSGETPMLFAQIREAEKELAEQPKSLDLIRKVTHFKSQIRDQRTVAEAYKTLITAEEANVAANPKDGSAHRCLSLAYWYSSRPKDALASAQKATELDPKNHHCWMMLYWALHSNNSPDALAAFRKAQECTPEDDIDTRISQAMIRATTANQKYQQAQQMKHAEKGGTIRLPAILEEDRNSAEKEYSQAIAEMDKVLKVASRKFKDNAGQCGLDTREKCLGLLFIRDMFQAVEYPVVQAGANTEVGGAYIREDTVKLMREVVPFTSEDPVRLVTAFFVEFLSNPEIKKHPNSLPASIGKTMEPYLKRLRELGKHSDSSVAATACYMEALLRKLTVEDHAESEKVLEQCVKLCPEFNDGWQLMLVNQLDQKKFISAIRVGNAWHKQKGNELSLFALTKVYAEMGDWKKVHEYCLKGLEKYPDSMQFKLSLIACELQEGEPLAAAAKAKADLVKIGMVLQETKDQRLILNYQLLCMTYCLLENDLISARKYGSCPCVFEKDPTRKLLLTELLKDDSK